ncbi:putative nuclear pore localization protein NPL4 [Chloropicon primus]|uniref:Putative nuclear pore localization protein NPL4 n=1 Tax=Chloropicon primus TaxID=1764295 RepID=A0A5B8MFS6_9CHLO|nr:putative nuclear pore localization protein NPL4 [Chloropicon primus]UPQ98446.1 putative nuclear pore localization protein NPL4 [Chloropicon primus]|eukprot:QDZ19237.1 putative nuclear pore localization protein NPL4 [Chloropicon primus]
MERVKVRDGASLRDLRSAIEEVTGVPSNEQRLSEDQNLLKPGESGKVKLLDSTQGLKHGSMVYLAYGYERDVPAATRKSQFEERAFGTSMTVAEMIAKQTRIERQEQADCASVSLERHAANAFQLYVNQGIAFSIKRCGFMYGTVDEEKNVRVEFIYEPPQDGSKNEILVHAQGTEELDKVETIVGLLGLKRVGYIFSQSSEEKDYLISTQELAEMANMQEEFGDTFVTAVVSMVHSEEGVDIHFEAYQCTRQCVKLRSEGWFKMDEDEVKHSGVSTLVDPREPAKEKPVIVAGKDTNRVDNEWFLCPVKILDHEGLFTSDFAVENRLTAQDTGELKAYLKQRTGKPFVRTLSDFHLLLFLAKNSNMDANDIALIVQAVASQSDPGEGYKIIIESLAGI